MENCTRRDFLKTTAVGAAGLALMSTAVGCAAEGKPDAPAAAAGASQSITAAQYNEKWAFEIPPEPIADEDIAETFEAEVIVVGSGTAGLVAANSLLDQGVDVLLFSASSIPVSRGGSNHAVMSKCKERFGLPADDEMLFEREIINNGMAVDQQKWYKFYNHSEEAMNWLIDIMEAKGYETGLEQRIEFLEDGNYFNFVGAHGFMTPEAHTMGMNQQFVVDELAARLDDAGKPVHFNTIAKQLVRDEDGKGRVSAVIALCEDGTYAKYVGSKAIVLATGDFSTNREMMYKYAPYTAQIISDDVYDAEPNYDRCFEYGGIYPGDGQQMGLWIGAAWQKIWPCCPMGGAVGAGPNNKFLMFSGLRVNREGQRFMKEYGLRDTGGYANRMQPGSEVHALWNADYARKFPITWIDASLPYGEDATMTPEEVIAGWDKNAENGTFFKADTLEGLIDAMGLPKEEALNTVARYNELCAKGVDEDFHKDPRFMISLENGPFYGQTGNSPLFLTILGGLRTNSEMQVCDEDDNPIAGLYNIGTMVGDMYGVNYSFQIPGFNLGATCVTFGYLVGKHIAEND